MESPRRPMQRSSSAVSWLLLLPRRTSKEQTLLCPPPLSRSHRFSPTLQRFRVQQLVSKTSSDAYHPLDDLQGHLHGQHVQTSVFPRCCTCVRAMVLCFTQRDGTAACHRSPSPTLPPAALLLPSSGRVWQRPGCRVYQITSDS